MGQKVLYRCRVLLIDGEKLELVSGHPQKKQPEPFMEKRLGLFKSLCIQLVIIECL